MRLSANGRLEYKLPDASVNPYLSHAALIAAAADGLDNALDPGPAQVGSSYGEDSARFAPLPLTLIDAIHAFQKDDVVRGALGDDMADLLVDVKSDEWARFCATVTDWEQERYEQAIP